MVEIPIVEGGPMVDTGVAGLYGVQADGTVHPSSGVVVRHLCGGQQFATGRQWVKALRWWKKSCTTWHGTKPVNNGRNHLFSVVQDFATATVGNGRDNSGIIIDDQWTRPKMRDVPKWWYWEGMDLGGMAAMTHFVVMSVSGKMKIENIGWHGVFDKMLVL